MRSAIILNGMRHAIVCNLGCYARIVAADVWKASLGFDIPQTAGATTCSMVWRVVMTFIVRSTRVMSRFSDCTMEMLSEPHSGQASGVCSSNSVGFGLHCGPRGLFVPRATSRCRPHPRGPFDPGMFLWIYCRYYFCHLFPLRRASGPPFL